MLERLGRIFVGEMQSSDIVIADFIPLVSTWTNIRHLWNKSRAEPTVPSSEGKPHSYSIYLKGVNTLRCWSLLVPFINIIFAAIYHFVYDPRNAALFLDEKMNDAEKREMINVIRLLQGEHYPSELLKIGLLCDKIDGKNKLEFVQLFSTIPLVKRTDLLNYMTKVKQRIDFEKESQLIDIFENLPESTLNKFLDATSSSYDCLKKDYNKAIEFFGKASKADRAKYFTDIYDLTFRNSLTLTGLNSLVRCAHNLTKEMNFQDKKEVIFHLAKIERSISHPDQIGSLFSGLDSKGKLKILSFLTQSILRNKKNDLLDMFLKTPQDKKIELADSITNFLNAYPYHLHEGEINKTIDVVINSSQAELSKLFVLINSLKCDYKTAIGLFEEYGQGDRVKCFNNLNQLMNGLNSVKKHLLIQALNKIPLENRENSIEECLDLTKGMSSAEKIKMMDMQAFNKNPIDFVKDANALTREMDVECKLKAINILNKVPDNNRKRILDHFDYITGLPEHIEDKQKIENLETLRLILKQVALCGNEETNTLVKQYNEWFIKISCIEKNRLVDSLSIIHHDNRNSFINEANDFLKNVNDSEKITAFYIFEKIFKNVDSQIRTSFIEHFNKLTVGIDFCDKGDAIDILQKIPNDKRESFIADINAMTAGMISKDKINGITIFHALPDVDVRSFIRNLNTDVYKADRKWTINNLIINADNKAEPTLINTYAEKVRNLALQIDLKTIQHPFKELKDFWQQTNLTGKHSFVQQFKHKDYEVVREVLADTVYRHIDNKRNVQWLNEDAISDKLELNIKGIKTFSKGFFYHATSEMALQSILTSKKVEVRHEKAYRGAFVSTQPELCFGKCVLVFNRSIERLSKLSIGFILDKKTYWAGFSSDIPVEDNTLAYIILDSKLEEERRALEYKCLLWANRKISVVLIDTADQVIKKVEALGMGIPNEWPFGGEKVAVLVYNSLKAHAEKMLEVERISIFERIKEKAKEQIKIIVQSIKRDQVKSLSQKSQELAELVYDSLKVECKELREEERISIFEYIKEQIMVQIKVLEKVLTRVRVREYAYA